MKLIQAMKKADKCLAFIEAHFPAKQMTMLSLSSLRIYARSTALKYTMCVCLANAAVTDPERCILSTSPYIQWVHLFLA